MYDKGYDSLKKSLKLNKTSKIYYNLYVICNKLNKLNEAKYITIYIIQKKKEKTKKKQKMKK